MVSVLNMRARDGGESWWIRHYSLLAMFNFAEGGGMVGVDRAQKRAVMSSMMLLLEPNTDADFRLFAAHIVEVLAEHMTIQQTDRVRIQRVLEVEDSAEVKKILSRVLYKGKFFGIEDPESVEGRKGGLDDR